MDKGKKRDTVEVDTLMPEKGTRTMVVADNDRLGLDMSETQGEPSTLVGGVEMVLHKAELMA